MPNESFENIVDIIGQDTFVRLVPQLRKVSTISEIEDARKRNDILSDGETSLRDVWLYGGDGPVYGLVGDDVWLFLTNANNNPSLENPVEFECEMAHKNNFFLNSAKSKIIREKANNPSDQDVFSFNLSELERQGRLVINSYEDSDDFSHIKVSTEKLAEGRIVFALEYGQEVTSFFDRVRGISIYGNEGIGALLLQRNKNTTSIGVLRPDYVKALLKRKEKGTMILCSSCIFDFDYDSDVMLDYRDIGNDEGYLRGVAKENKYLR